MRRATLGAIAALGCTVLAVTATAAGMGAGPMTLRSWTNDAAYVPGELVVRFKAGTKEAARTAALAHENAAVRQALLLPGAFVVSLPKGEAVASAAEAFEQHPDVLYAEPNWRYRASATVPNDPLFPQLWGLNQNTDRDIDAPEAWDRTTGSAAVKVAVVDTGVAYDHPDLAPNMAGPNFDFFSNDTNARDENGHGTHVAGTIGARGNDATGVAGVNWNVGLMAVRVLGPAGQGSNASVTNGFVFAAANGAKIVNASLGGALPSQAMKDAIDAAAATTLFVVAAGNDASNNEVIPQYPCNYTSVNLVCVAATNQTDELADFSNFGGSSVDLAAPGVDTVSTWPAYSDLFTETFETDLTGRWLAGGTPNTWARTNERSASGAFSAADSPGGDYSSNANNWLATATPVSFAGRTGCKVGYALRLATEFAFDGILVESSTDGVSWTVRDAWTGFTSAGAFLPFETDLSALDGQPSVRLRFRLISDGDVVEDGAHVDDVVLRCLSTTYGADDYNGISGTSMATPHVAGVAALLWARRPTASVAEVRDALLNSVDVLGGLAGQVATSGRLNAAKAVQAIEAAPAPPPPPPPASPAPPPPLPPAAPQPQPRPPAVLRCVVPNVKGKTLAASRAALARARCSLGRVTRAYSRRVRKGRIVSQSRRPGARLPRGTRVNVLVSRGRRR